MCVCLCVCVCVWAGAACGAHGGGAGGDGLRPAGGGLQPLRRPPRVPVRHARVPARTHTRTRAHTQMDKMTIYNHGLEGFVHLPREAHFRHKLLQDRFLDWKEEKKNLYSKFVGAVKCRLQNHLN